MSAAAAVLHVPLTSVDHSESLTFLKLHVLKLRGSRQVGKEQTQLLREYNYIFSFTKVADVLRWETNTHSCSAAHGWSFET